MSDHLPLAGLTVVAVEQAVAAPFCTSRLADAGAHVIKIERPEGDFARGYDNVANGLSSYFVWRNRGKESIVLDLSSPEGNTKLARLIESADVVVQNLKPGAFARLGFAPDALLARHPRLILCSISGYGETGPMADRKAYDLLIQAESGLSSITGGPDGAARVGISVVDIATGATAHAAILEALIERVRNRRLTDALVAKRIASMTTAEAERRLLAAGTAFAQLNGLTELAHHPHLRRITVDTEYGPLAMPAPAPIIGTFARSYGSVPALNDCA